MRHSFLASAICFSLVLCSCAGRDEMKFSPGTGDVGKFILRKAIDFGAHSSPANAKPVETSWQYSEDQEGVVIRTDPKDCSSLESLLRQSFDAAYLRAEGAGFLVYRLTPKGGGIQMICNSNYVQIIILKAREAKQPANMK